MDVNTKYLSRPTALRWDAEQTLCVEVNSYDNMTQSVRRTFRYRAPEKERKVQRTQRISSSATFAYLLNSLLFKQLMVLILLPVWSMAQQPENNETQLDRYLQEAAQNNPELESRFYEYRSVLEQAPQVGTLPDPEIMFMYFANPGMYSDPLRRMTVSLQQMFPWFGSLNSAEESIRQQAKAKLESLINARNNLFMDIKEVWYRMYEMKHHTRVLEDNLKLLEILESTAMSRYETGYGSQVDVIRVQLEIDKVNTRILQMEDKLVPLRIRFNTLLNRDTRAAIDIPMPMELNVLALSPDEIVQKIKSQNPRLTQLDYHREAAEQMLTKARQDGLPSFGVGLEAMFPDYMYMPLMPGDRTAFVARFSVRIPLYRSRYNAQKQEAKLNIRSIEVEKTDVANRLLADAEKKLQEYRDTQYRIDLYKDKLIPKTDQALDVAMEAYSTEAENFEELIQLQEQLLDYEMSLNTAHVERNIAIAELEYLYGKYNATPEEIETKYGRN